MKSFAIGIPTINQWELLKGALLKYLDNDFKDIQIFIVDNGKQGIREYFSEHTYKMIRVIEPGRNLGVAASWNTLCYEIFLHHEHALILNDDIYLGSGLSHYGFFDNSTAFMEYLIFLAPSMTAAGHFGLARAPGLDGWSSFMLPKTTYKKIGRFDERFYPAYFEDNDYEYRLKLAGLTTLELPFRDGLEGYFHRSMSIKKDPSLNVNYAANRARYIIKWGGPPGSEAYTTPFDGQQVPIA